MMESIIDKGLPESPLESRVEDFRKFLGPFVVAADAARMSMVFTESDASRHPIVFANDSFLMLTGLRREDVLGTELVDLLGRITDGPTLSGVKDALVRGTPARLETRCRSTDGREHAATLLLSPVRDSQGLMRQYFATLERSDGGASSTERPVQKNDLHDQSPVFIASATGPDHRFTFANRAYKRLVRNENLVGRTVAEALPELVEQGFIGLLDEVLRSGQPFVGTCMPISLDSEDDGTATRYVSFVYQPVRDEQGQVTGIFCEGYDVTAEKLAGSQLAALQAEVAHLWRVNAMSMMATTIAHELNQPLTAICNYAAGGLRLLDSPKDHAEALRAALYAIDDAARQAGDIISNVRTLMRRGETGRTDFNLRGAVAECVRLVKAGVYSHVAIDNMVPAEFFALADRVQIQQVGINLMRNALQAADGSSKALVRVGASRVADRLVISVSDTGSGLSAEAAESMFDWAHSSKQGGMGLGLSISRSIVESHDGRIWLEKSDATGSEFCFSVPAGTDRGVAHDCP